MKKTLIRVIIPVIALLYFFAGVQVMLELDAQEHSAVSEEYKVKCRKISSITGEECFVNEEGDPVRGFIIEDPQPGDIFVTASTHSFGWRHGHVALVVEAEPLKTIEAVVVGEKSRIIENPMWERYPTFAQLRLKEELGGKEAGAKAAEYALQNLNDCSYGFFCRKDFDERDEKAEKYHCAHLVWRAYKEIGIDIDSDGGKLVTPFDIYSCDHFERIAVYPPDSPIKP